MKWHALKTEPAIYNLVSAGLKTAEVRKDDRNYQVGDLLILFPFDRETNQETSSESCLRKITHKLVGGQYGIEPGFCLLSMTEFRSELKTKVELVEALIRTIDRGESIKTASQVSAILKDLFSYAEKNNEGELPNEQDF